MRMPNKWVVLATAHLAVLSCLTLSVTLVAVRFGKRTDAPREVVASSPANPPSEAEIARLGLLSTRIKVLQDNLANSETVAFKRQMVYIEGGIRPKIADCQLDMSQGALESTNRNTDLAIQGDGFFRVKVRPTVADGTAYTRNGMLRRKRDGRLVVAVGDGYPLVPPITVPMDATNITVGQDGTVSYLKPVEPTRTLTAGRIGLWRFASAEGLIKFDGSLYTESTESGPPILGAAGEGGMGQLQQGYLETSNVDPQLEWAAILRARQLLQLDGLPTPRNQTQDNQPPPGHA